MQLMPKRGPLRINAPLKVQYLSQGPASVAAPGPPGYGGDPYLQRLVKLVPSEVLALYITFKEIATSWLGIWAAICLVLVVFVRTIGTHQAGKPIQIIAITVATVSFVLWVYATGGYFFELKLPANIPGVISIAVGVWTFIVPYICKGD
jgi:hypothetical protein